MNHCIYQRCLAGAALFTILLAGCGKQEAKELPAAKNVIGDLQQQVTFTDEIIEKNMEETNLFFEMDDTLVKDSASLVGSGATAESLSVWKAQDEASAETIAQVLETFNSNWIEGYSDYKPEEVPKLETAVFRREGDCVIYAVTADNEAAADAIDALFK